MTDVNVKFLKEYSSAESLKQYTTATAGYGINYLLDHDYKDIYLNAIQHLTDLQHPEGLNILEYGCGLNGYKENLKIMMRRYGSEFRDNYLSKNEFLLSYAKKIKNMTKM